MESLFTRRLIKVYTVRYCTYNDKFCFSSSFFISYTSGYFNSLENKNFPSHCFLNLGLVDAINFGNSIKGGGNQTKIT